MAETVRKLQLIFLNGDGGQSTISPKYFDESLINDPEKVKAWMDKFSALNVFHHQEKDIPLYTGKKNARVIETKTIEIF
ncbi:DUF2922 domain-containing protein [uncultured Vagococcus sp.]|uniref:DUF2922 domain-containing protein n=1 Tax=uncultured Vagococcus sp. TaxID=189676 RepID=UPI0028D76F98|nr:DUF2922 domain-containing protein [uncultured Vagococcus sp.]